MPDVTKQGNSRGKPARGRGPKRLSGEDAELWALVTAEVTPMKGRTGPEEATPNDATGEDAPAPQVKTSTGIGMMTLPLPVRKTATPQSRELDRRTRERFERGQMAIDAQLDLHGCGQGAAREKLHGFLSQAWASALRCVLVITGKGRQSEGVLRTRVPEWAMEAPVRHMVLEISQARPAHGGTGAYYILLRRQRPS